MPLGRFLKILFSGLFALVVGLVVAVEFSLIESYGDVSNYAAYEQAAKVSYDYVYATGAAIIKWPGDRSHDDWLELLTGTIALFTGCLWWSTHRLWKAGEKQITVTQIAADAATQTADIANRTLIATQRPWVNLNVEIAGPLFFDGNGAGIKLKITTENTGTTPATNILAHPMIFCREQQPYQAREIIERRSVTFGVGGGLGHALFKNNRFPEINTPSMEAREYASETAISPFVLVAVKYQSTLGNETYMTAKLYHLLRLDPAHPGQAFVVNPGVDVPANLLELKIIGSHAV